MLSREEKIQTRRNRTLACMLRVAEGEQKPQYAWETLDNGSGKKNDVRASGLAYSIKTA